MNEIKKFSPPHHLNLGITKINNLGWESTRSLLDMYRRMIMGMQWWNILWFGPMGGLIIICIKIWLPVKKSPHIPWKSHINQKSLILYDGYIKAVKLISWLNCRIKKSGMLRYLNWLIKIRASCLTLAHCRWWALIFWKKSNRLVIIQKW